MVKETDRSPKTGFVTGVLSFRGLLALLVATSHTLNFTILCNYAGSVLDQRDLDDALAKLVGTMINVPMIFFVISGLAIARSLDRKDEFGQGFRTYLIFIFRRVLRLYPAHTAATVGVIVLAWLFLMDRPPVDVSAYSPTGLDFLAGWLNGAVFNPLKMTTVVGNFLIATWSMNLVVWSLYVEVCAIPFLPLLHQVARDRNPATDAVVLGCLATIAILTWGHLTFQYLFAFYLGMLVQTRGRESARWLVQWTGGSGRATILAWTFMLLPSLWPLNWLPATFIQAASAFAIINLIVWREGDAAAGLLDWPVLRWAGRMSYSFYLWHYIILTVAIRELHVLLPAQTVLGLDWLVFAVLEIVTVAAALAIAQLSYSYVEEPCILWGVRMEAAWRRVTPPTFLPMAGGRRSPQAAPEGAD